MAYPSDGTSCLMPMELVSACRCNISIFNMQLAPGFLLSLPHGAASPPPHCLCIGASSAVSLLTGRCFTRCEEERTKSLPSASLSKEAACGLESNAYCTLHCLPHRFSLLQDYEDSLAGIIQEHKEAQPASAPQHVSHTFSRRSSCSGAAISVC